MKAIDMTGKQLHNWIVLRKDESKPKGKVYWICECQCPNKSIRSVAGINLRAGSHRSCGCLHSKNKVNKFDFSNDFIIGYTEKEEMFYLDADDYNLIKDYYWFLNSHGYPCTKRMGKDILMHRLILNVDVGYTVDHINHDVFDNRRENLRIVTHDKNMLNKNKYINNTSGYSGVVWNKKDQKWVARIQINKKQVELGRFVDKNEAIAVRKNAELKYYGEYRNKLIYD